MLCTLALASTGAAFCNRNSPTSQWPARDAMCRGVSTFYKCTLAQWYVITYSKFTVQAQLAVKTYIQSEIKLNVAFKRWNSMSTWPHCNILQCAPLTVDIAYHIWGMWWSSFLHQYLHYIQMTHEGGHMQWGQSWLLDRTQTDTENWTCQSL